METDNKGPLKSSNYLEKGITFFKAFPGTRETLEKFIESGSIRVKGCDATMSNLFSKTGVDVEDEGSAVNTASTLNSEL